MFYSPNSDNLIVRAPVNTFYEHINGGGVYYTLLSGERQEFVGNWWNDRISSVRVAPRSVVILYEHRGFRGYSMTFENPGNTPYLFNLSRWWNDKTSSIITYELA